MNTGAELLVVDVRQKPTRASPLASFLAQFKVGVHAPHSGGIKAEVLFRGVRRLRKSRVSLLKFELDGRTESRT